MSLAMEKLVWIPVNWKQYTNNPFKNKEGCKKFPWNIRILSKIYSPVFIIATPLTDLTRKQAPNIVNWDSKCEQAFCKLKDVLCSAPVLQSPNFEKDFILQTDTYEC